MSTGSKDKDALINLFSTRSLQSRLIEGRSIDSLPANPGASSVPSSSNTTTRRQAPRSGTQASLSPLASTVLREARRELGSDLKLQQAQQEGQGISEEAIAAAVDRVIRKRGEPIDDIERANVIIHLQKDLMGWGVLQPLIDNNEVTDIHVYDYQTVVLQRGKISEITGLHWPNKQAYVAFIDRLLLRLGKSLTTQQHTVDASFPNGIRICAIHESVCGIRGPLLCIRIPRVVNVSLEGLVSYQVAPPLIVNYMASLVRSGLCTQMIAGETGTGKTTLIRCLGTQFGPDESIIAVEDTPELIFQHPFFRSLISRPPNAEGVGEVTLQEHIKTTLRMTPTRVLLGEMRTPYAAEAFLESAQTGHVGMSTIHARNARETLVRLESLLGRAQKSVSIDIIRQQIALAVDSVVWMFREKGSGRIRIGEVIEVGHFVEGVIQVRPMFKLIETGERPVWRVESWSSNFDSVLADDGIFLGDHPREITFNDMDTESKKERH
ncbi:MAG: CpaF family protein [SAR324 cluster bacterium]|uniref:CpaF family protein n=1 Tax=SAR324 cluster bacterium TaxID=2024889 RepID=A0A7X9FSD1_9DELT|nr:CpaF family protein [SAR324 cluster bacterium]